MATVGRAFGFYIKHWKEINPCYEDGPSKKVLRRTLPTGVEDRVDKVGRCASKQAAEFLAKCRTEVEKHFSKTLGCQTRITERRSTVEEYWSFEIGLGLSGSRRSKRAKWDTGALITKLPEDEHPALFLWIWAGGSNGQGSRQAEEQLASLLGKRTKGRSALMEMDWATGSVVFGIIKLKVKPDDTTFEIGEARLLKKVGELLKIIRKKDVVKLFKI